LIWPSERLAPQTILSPLSGMRPPQIYDDRTPFPPVPDHLKANLLQTEPDAKPIRMNARTWLKPGLTLA
jgi:hypothetical protein